MFSSSFKIYYLFFYKLLKSDETSSKLDQEIKPQWPDSNPKHLISGEENKASSKSKQVNDFQGYADWIYNKTLPNNPPPPKKKKAFFGYDA